MSRPKDELVIRAVEAIQSAVDGGYPIDNKTAYSFSIEHGTPLLTVSKRDLISFLKRVRGEQGLDSGLVIDIDSMLKEWDHFVCPVESDERLVSQDE